MATSPNFNWPEPDNTDLVKNGALAIRTAVNAIDTSLVDLKGGTTGQVLSKASNTDMDFTWVTDAGGDITGVTAGTGISGGGTSGTVTVTNSMATAITTAGDLIKGTGSGTFDRLGIGSTGQVLTVTAGAPAWATPATSTPTFVGCVAKKTASQTTSAATYTIITFEAEDIDTNGFHSTASNTGRITIPTGYAGKYLITGQISTVDGDQTHTSAIFKNGTRYNTLTSFKSAQSGAGGSSQNLIMDLAVGDYVEFAQYSGSGVSVAGTTSNDRPSLFQCQFLGA